MAKDQGVQKVFLENKILNEKEFFQKKTVLASRPRGLVVTLTTRCNIRCFMCNFWQHTMDMPEKVVQEIVALFPYLQEIHWQGGEVFLYDGFQDLFVEAARFPHIKQHINTNGLLIDEDWAKRLAANDGLFLDFSIDGVDKETYERIRVEGRFDDLIRNIERLNAYRKSSSAKIITCINAVIMRSNFRQLEAFFDFAHQYGFDQLQLSCLQTTTHSENIFLHKDEEALRFIEEAAPVLIQKAAQYQIMFHNCLPVGRVHKDYIPEDSRTLGKNPDEVTKEKGVLCYLPWHYLFIHFDGRVFPHCLCQEKLGDIASESIAKLWNNERMQSYRTRLLENSIEGWCQPHCISGEIPRGILVGHFRNLTYKEGLSEGAPLPMKNY